MDIEAGSAWVHPSGGFRGTSCGSGRGLHGEVWVFPPGGWVEDWRRLVSQSEWHSAWEPMDFVGTVIRHAGFAKVTDIVVGFGNARYQRIIDRYIAGEDVPQRNFSLLRGFSGGQYPSEETAPPSV